MQTSCNGSSEEKPFPSQTCLHVSQEHEQTSEFSFPVIFGMIVVRIGDHDVVGKDLHLECARVATVGGLPFPDFFVRITLPASSTVSIWFCRVDMLELTASILGGKPPVYG